MMEFEQIAIKADKDFSIQTVFNETDSIWTEDIVIAKGVILDPHNRLVPVENVAELRFNYEVIPGKEFELLHYHEGPNFLDEKWAGTLSHFGVHVPKIDDFRQYLENKKFHLVQEVVTVSHTNVPKDRHYHYAIFRHMDMDFHWKLIERLVYEKWDNAKHNINARYHCDIF